MTTGGHINRSWRNDEPNKVQRAAGSTRLILPLLLVAALVSACGASSSSAPKLTTARSHALTKDLKSNNAGDVADAIALPAHQQLAPATLQALASLQVTFELATFHPSGSDSATITAVVTPGPGEATQNWDVALLLENGKWKLAASSLQSTP